MQCLCAGLKDKGNGNGNAEEECDHSFCTVQRQKKTAKCVDLPPKGLPWSSGYLKYLPGQRNFYKDLYLKDQADMEAAKMQAVPPPKKCKGKNGKRKSEVDAACLCYCAALNANGNGNGGGGKKKRRSKSEARPLSQRPSMSTSCGQDSESRTNNFCVEFEEVLVCDGNNPQPRKGFIIKPCKRPEADQALSVATESMREGEAEGNSSLDKGVICLCIPRAYLEQYRGAEEDLCAKYGVKMECPEEASKPSEDKTTSEATVESSSKKTTEESSQGG